MLRTTRTRRNIPRQRQYNSSAATEIKDIISNQLPGKQSEVKKLRTQYGNVKLGEINIGMLYGGMRGMKGLVTETSLLDAEEGIRFRGYSIPELQEKLPKLNNASEPLPEGLLWLLLTGEIPSADQVSRLSKDMAARAEEPLPEEINTLIENIPRTLHPMTQFSMSIMALQQQSKFAQAYRRGTHKSKFWEYAFDDSMDLISRLPYIASVIYQKTYKNASKVQNETSSDWSANYAKMMGFESPEFTDLMRLYLTIHTDHEGGNVSAHTTHLVGSALSDPYLSLSAGMNGLAGPLHGLANQEVLRWLKQLKQRLGDRPATKENLTDVIWETLNAGQVVPGYGHAVLRKTDPRYTVQREFALKHLKNNELFELVSNLYEVVPDILTKHGKTKNPWPNVDAHSGVLLQHYGLVEEDYYTVMFGVSRAIGVLSSLVWDRALGLPIERPKSVTTEWIKNYVKKTHPGN